MIDLTTAPSSLLKKLDFIARGSLWLLLVMWLVFLMAWGALHWLIVPRIGDFRPQLEARASQVLGVPVRIGALRAQSHGLIPSIEITQIQLFDADGREALRLPRVLAALSPRSIWNLGFEQLYIDRPELSIRRAVDGTVYVAGLDFTAKRYDAESSGLEWFFSQIEFVIHDGTIQWTDEMRARPTLSLRQVELVVRNRGRLHDFRVDATPPPAWGERFSLMARFRQPLLLGSRSQWRTWDGQVYGAFERVDLSELRRYADLGVDLRQGNGAVRAWAQVRRGQWTDVVADVALAQVDVRLAADLQALELQSVRTRLGVRQLPRGYEVSTQALDFDTRDGLHWPAGDSSAMYLRGEGNEPPRGEFKADTLDLAALSQIADRLPIEPKMRASLMAYAPKGQVQRVQASWQGDWGAMEKYEAKGQVSALAWSAQALEPPQNGAGSPGIRGLNAEFELNQSGGRARLDITDGAVEVPGVFDDPTIAVGKLTSDVQWQIKGEHIAVQLSNMKFSNADAQGEAQIKWETSDPARSGARARFPGVLDLQAVLNRADGTRVYRYLPTVLSRSVRDYVRDAFPVGTASGARFRVKGDLYDMPFKDPKKGEFRISADVHNATYRYVPASIQSPGELPWPALTQLNGELVIERTQLQVRNARARFGNSANVQATRVDAVIPDMDESVVSVNAELRGPLAEVLGIVNSSPLSAMTEHALEHTVATGMADYQFKLGLPLSHMEHSTVQGSITLGGNDVHIAPQTPKLSRARGVVSFSESGFSLAGVQARMLGGDVRLDGGWVTNAVPARAGNASRPTGPNLIRASGTASAEGLRQARELGFVARLAQHASGNAAYSAVLGWRRGEPELLVTSTLQGMALALPAPFNKSPEAVLPLRLESALVRDSWLPGAAGQVRLRDQLTLELGRTAAITFQRELAGAQARVVRGSIAIGLAGDESVPLPEEGVVANIQLAEVDLDAWSAALSQAAGATLTAPAAVPDGTGATAAGNPALAYLPTSMAIRARALVLGGRKLHHVVVGGAREGLLWRANLDADELNGYVEYRQPSGASEGRVYARLARLSIAPAAAADVETILNEQPASIPALDIVVDDFDLRGKRLGRVEVEAINRSAGAQARDGGVREWRLNKFNMITPEAVLTANGNWASVNAQAGQGRAAASPRRTVMKFKLDIHDGGGLLARFGMKDVVRRARGKMEGQIAWQGSPLTLDYPSLAGAFTVNVEAGQFLKAEPGIAKLLGVLSLQSLPRRLTLDFRDVFSQGFAFDFVRGDVTIEQGMAKTNNLQMKGVNAAVLMEGQADIARETQELKVVVVPEINAGTASLIASVINPAVGLGTFLAQMFLRKPFAEAATQEFFIDGSWVDPKITKVERKPAKPNEVNP